MGIKSSTTLDAIEYRQRLISPLLVVAFTMPFLFRSVYFYLMLLLMIFLSSAIVHTSPSRQPHEARRIPEEPWPDPVFKLNVSLDILSWDNLSIKLPPPVTSIDQNISELYINSLQTSLPYLLQQLNVDPARLDALVAEGIPLLQEAFFGLFSSDPGIWTDEVISDPDGPRSPDPISRLMRRGWFSKLKRWLKEIAIDAGCSIVAAAALPVYLIAADAFAVGNLFNGHNTQQDQDFYLRPVHGSVSHDDDIKVHYNAWFAPGFGSNVAGVTMGREIYLRGGNAEIWNNPDFMSVTKLLLHEFTHTLQYRDFLYFIPNFGFEYIFYTCKVRPES